MEIIKTTALITINETLWVQMLCFLLFLFLINRVMFRPVRRRMADREALFDGLKSEARQLNEEMKRLATQVAQEEEAAKAAAGRMRADLLASAQEDAVVILRRARKDIDQMRKAAESRLAESMAEARKTIGAESRDLSAAIIASILERNPRP
ncbi:MAG: hypothetical protein PVH30_05675 [Desulfobacterales bacterium]|jgi:F-type H+-transporting ATPase subunit b